MILNQSIDNNGRYVVPVSTTVDLTTVIAYGL